MHTCSRFGLIEVTRKLYEERLVHKQKLKVSSNLSKVVHSHLNSIHDHQNRICTNSTSNNSQRVQVDAIMMEVSNDKEDICYHHFALMYNDEQLVEKLSDVLFVLIAGSTSRVEAHAKYLEQLQLFKNNNWNVERLTNTSGSRFNLFKVGPVLLANHGIGSASMSVAVFELLLMCKASGRLDKITLIRFGTCGGIGVEPGTVCITNKVYDALFRSFVDWPVCGEIVRRESIIDDLTFNKLMKLGQLMEQDSDSFKVVGGATMSTHDFYEEQGRTNGPICDHSLVDKMNFLKRVQQNGIVNMEMEANVLASICHKLKVKHGIICVALTNRLVQDKITVSHDVISNDYEFRLFKLNARFIEHTLTTPSK